MHLPGPHLVTACHQGLFQTRAAGQTHLIKENACMKYHFIINARVGRARTALSGVCLHLGEGSINN